jgi:hypothetical protein
VVYDVANRRIHYRTRSHLQERTLDLKGMDFAGGHSVQFFNLRSQTDDAIRFQPALADPTPAFQDLSEARHRRYVEGYLAQVWFRRGFGDMSPLMEAMLLHLRNDTCLDASAVADTTQPGKLESSPSAEEIMRKTLAARGGQEAASRLQSLHGQGFLDASWQKRKHLPLETFATRSNKLLVSVDTKPASPSGHYEYGFDGQRGWEIAFGAPLKVLEGKALDECREAAEFLLDEPGEYVSMHCLGEASFDGRSCLAVKVVRKSGNEEIHYYAPATYLQAGELKFSAASETWVKTSMGDYREFDGFKFPMWTECRRQRNNFAVRSRSIEINTVEDSVFKMPTGGLPKGNAALRPPGRGRLASDQSRP